MFSDWASFVCPLAGRLCPLLVAGEKGGRGKGRNVLSKQDYRSEKMLVSIFIILGYSKLSLEKFNGAHIEQ